MFPASWGLRFPDPDPNQKRRKTPRVAFEAISGHTLGGHQHLTNGCLDPQKGPGGAEEAGHTFWTMLGLGPLGRRSAPVSPVTGQSPFLSGPNCKDLDPSLRPQLRTPRKRVNVIAPGPTQPGRPRRRHRTLEAATAPARSAAHAHSLMPAVSSQAGRTAVADGGCLDDS